MAAKVSPSESKEEIPRDLPSRLTTKQEGRNNNFQDIACRRRSVPPRILDPQEHMEPFGTSKSLNKTDRREQKNRETQWQEHRPQIWLVDKTEENNQAILCGNNWKYFPITLEPFLVTLDTLSLKNNLESGSLKRLPKLYTSNNPAQANIQGFEIHIVK